jgi:hypothetical protein
MLADMDLYTRLASIGINVSSEQKLYSFADIEKTLVFAAEQIPNDKRLLSLLLSWIKLHGERVNIERLKKLATKDQPIWLSLMAHFASDCGQTRWKILINDFSQGKYALGDKDLTQSLISMRGEESWSAGSAFLIPKHSVSIDEKFILNAFQLAKINSHYRNKLIYGSNWRADIITAIQAGAKNPFQAAKISHSSYEPAHRAFDELKTADVLDSFLG